MRATRIAVLIGLLLGLCRWSMAEGRTQAQGNTLTVRVYWLQPPKKIEVTGGTLKRCDGCQAAPVAGVITVEAKGERVRISGSKATVAVVVAGENARIQVPGGAGFSSGSRLEIRAHKGRLLLTMVMPLEEYVAAVLAGESAGFQSDEALKAMAVAARTYALRFRGRHKSEGFDFCDTTHCQDFRVSAVTPRLRAAVEATEGELLWYRGELASSYYTRSCGGHTEAGGAPYLPSQNDPYCGSRDREPWSSRIDKSELRSALTAAGVPYDGRSEVAAASRTESGRVKTLRVGGRTIAGEEFRLDVGRALGWDRVRSDLYDVSDRGDHLEFKGTGYGHGIGLCQRGAELMGEAGKSYREILAFYYPGTVLGVSARGFAWQTIEGERVDLITTRPQQDRAVLAMADKVVEQAEARTGWALERRVQVRIYPSLDAYRNATGSPGWVAATTRGRVVRLQPAEFLRGTLEATLRHEFFHVLVESHAKPTTPLWLREGVVLYLSGAQLPSIEMAEAEIQRGLTAPQTKAEQQRAYAAAVTKVRKLISVNGEKAVLGML